MKNLLEYLGFERERYHTVWISGSEGEKFADHMKLVVDNARRLGPCRKMRDAI
jgi:F420-non-reducing hydrogenase iron-sulfur subunit